MLPAAGVRLCPGLEIGRFQQAAMFVCDHDFARIATDGQVLWQTDFKRLKGDDCIIERFFWIIISGARKPRGLNVIFFLL